MRSRLLLALFAAYLVATGVHVAWVLFHEPFSFDAWNVAVDTHAQPFSVGNFLAYWWGQYTHSNPRLGQPLTYIGYKLDGFAEVMLAVSFLAVSLASTVLALGRFPRWGRDTALWTIAIGFSWFALPQIGRNLFCRAYGLNYVFGAAVQLWFLVPLRIAGKTKQSAMRSIAYALFGVIAGACNEHTGPMIVLLLGGYAWWLRHEGQSPRLVLAGLYGFVVGFAAIFFAPGQGERYDGLAQRASLIGRLIDRGVGGNFDIIRDDIVYTSPLIALILIVLVVSVLRGADEAGRKRSLRMIAIALGAGLLVAGTLFASPKLGPRFFFVSNAMLLAGFLALLDATFDNSKWLAPFVVFALIASGYAAFRTVPLFARVSVEGKQRMADLDATKPGGTYTADAWPQIDETWWFIGDDFRDLRKREMVAKYFALQRVYFRGYDKTAPLGMTGIHVVPLYTVDGDPTLHEDHGFELGITRGFDLEGMDHSLESSAHLLQDRIAPKKLAEMSIEVRFVDDPPVLPRPRLMIARWRAGKMTAWSGDIVRPGGGLSREVKLPKNFREAGYQLYIFNVGSDVKPLGADRTYVPWRKGVYWALACDADVCWVVGATRS
ncbi:MAG TPA: DUF6056 family protein [Kofleriaceae bacterium]|jgi:hypothetical protein